MNELERQCLYRRLAAVKILNKFVRDCSQAGLSDHCLPELTLTCSTTIGPYAFRACLVRGLGDLPGEK